MLRARLHLKLLASIVPLMMVSAFAREQFLPHIQPRVALNNTALRLAQTPWQIPDRGPLRVSFTDDPALATVRVQIMDTPENADFAVVDDANTDEASGCDAQGPSRYVTITERSPATPTVVYLTRDAHADYRIFVRSRTFTAEQAAALIVGAHATAATRS